MVRQALQLTNDLRHEGWPATDDVLKVPGHLPSQSQQYVRVLVKVLSQRSNLGLGGRGFIAALNLAQI